MKCSFHGLVPRKGPKICDMYAQESRTDFV